MELYLVKFLPPNLIRRYQKLLTYPDSMGHLSCTLSCDLVRKQWEGGRQKKRKGGEKGLSTIICTYNQKFTLIVKTTIAAFHHLKDNSVLQSHTGKHCIKKTGWQQRVCILI